MRSGHVGCFLLGGVAGYFLAGYLAKRNAGSSTSRRTL